MLSKGLVSGQDFWAKAHIALVFVTSTECRRILVSVLACFSMGWSWFFRFIISQMSTRCSIRGCCFFCGDIMPFLDTVLELLP